MQKHSPFQAQALSFRRSVFSFVFPLRASRGVLVLPWVLWTFFTLGLFGCAGDAPVVDPLLAYLPALPAASGPAVARAGVLTADNFDKEGIPGPAAQGLVGDYFMANDLIRVVVQQPGRAIAPLPYGGNIVDMDFVNAPVGDQFGEVGLFLLTGRTANFTDAAVVRDGSQGGPAVLQFRGADIRNDYIDVQALGPLSALFSDKLSADNQLGLQLAVTYILNPGASHVEVYYTFYNPSGYEVDTNWGTVTDAGGAVFNYVPGLGFADLDIEQLLADDLPPAEYLAQQGNGVSYGVIPQASSPQVGAIVLPITGVAVAVNDLKSKQDIFEDTSLTVTLPPAGGAQRLIRVGLARGGVDGIEGLVRREITKQPLHAVTGTLSGTVAGETIDIGVVSAGASGMGAPYSTLVVNGSDGQTAFSTSLLPGSYTLQAEGMSHRQSSPVALSVSAMPSDPPALVSLALPPPALLSYRITDNNGKLMPGKISVVGSAPPLLSGVTPASEHTIPGIVTVQHALSGDSSMNTTWDHPLAIAPGTYRIVVSRGPEWSRYEQKLTLNAGDKVTVNAALERVIDTAGYLACDFHQHSSNSPDSMTLLEQRVLNNLDEGTEFVTSADHDYVTDYRPIIVKLGAVGLLDSMPGEEMTPFGYGHFIGWPLTVDALSPNGGAFDWGGGELPDIAPAGIFAGVRKLGAQVLQVNHPRLAAPGLYDFQQNFDRAALHFDFAARTFYGDKNAMTLDPTQLGLPADAQVFADGFDALEVCNGVSTDPPDQDGERHDQRFERVLRDYMNFLSFGFTPVATGNSDTHGAVEPAGVPRTLVRVPDDSAAALTAGVADAVEGTLLGRGGAPRDVIVTNGPFLQLSAGSGAQAVGIGGTTSPAAGTLHIEMDVRSPDWMPITTMEVFANNTFQSPEPMTPEPLVPALCFSTQPVLSERCRQAPINGALTVEELTTAAGGRYLHAHVAVDADVATLLKINRPASVGQDLWLVARCFGNQSMFPVEASGINPNVDINQLLDGAPLTDQGAFPIALTNPIFVDVDGNGWRAPFSP